MTKSGKLMLAGTVSPLDDGPCFSVPIFTDGDGTLYWQELDPRSGAITSFKALGRQCEGMRQASAASPRKVGQSGMWAYRFSIDRVVVCTKSSLARTLRRELPSIRSRPYALLEVAHFIVDRVLIWTTLEQIFRDLTQDYPRIAMNSISCLLRNSALWEQGLTTSRPKPRRSTTLSREQLTTESLRTKETLKALARVKRSRTTDRAADSESPVSNADKLLDDHKVERGETVVGKSALTFRKEPPPTSPSASGRKRERLTGTILVYNPRSGKGIIEPDGGGEHCTFEQRPKRGGEPPFEVGDRVAFDFIPSEMRGRRGVPRSSTYDVGKNLKTES